MLFPECAYVLVAYCSILPCKTIFFLKIIFPKHLIGMSVNRAKQNAGLWFKINLIGTPY